MKDKDALFILGNDRVTQIYLQFNMREISGAIRQMMMNAKFYGIPADKLAKLLHDEVLWQEQVRKAYMEHLDNLRYPVEEKIDKESTPELC